MSVRVHAIVLVGALVACGGAEGADEAAESLTLSGTFALALGDLVFVPEQLSYCGTSPLPTFLPGVKLTSLRVQNTGAATSPTTEFDLVFPELGVTFPGTINPLPPGAAGNLPGVIPIQCFSPNCHFVLSVDPRRRVAEADEGNNLFFGGCSPASL